MMFLPVTQISAMAAQQVVRIFATYLIPVVSHRIAAINVGMNNNRMNAGEW